MRQTRLIAAATIAAGLAFGTGALAAHNFTASDAKLKGDTLTLDVTSPQPGWAVIHKVVNGKAGEHIGEAQISKGKNKNVRIHLTEKASPKEQLIVMLHEDKGQKGVFEFGEKSKVDVPVKENGKPVTDLIKPTKAKKRE